MTATNVEYLTAPNGRKYEAHTLLINWIDHPEPEPFERLFLIADDVFDLLYADEAWVEFDQDIFFYYESRDEFLADVERGRGEDWVILEVLS